MFHKQPTIGLALGSGGAKGLAHIGVIKVLKEHHIPIHIVTGSSIGALVGGLYAATKDIDAIEKLALETNWRQLLSLVDPSLRHGLIGGRKITNFIAQHLGPIEIKDVQIPFAAVATNLVTGEPVILNKGNLASAIRASISIPLVFRPIRYGAQLLTDGGLSQPIPAKLARDMGADIVIAVNLDADYFSETAGKSVGFRYVANTIIRMLRFHLAKENIQHADIVVVPKVGKVGWNKFFTSEKTRHVIKAGEDAMRAEMPALEEILASRKEGLFARLSRFLTSS